MERKKGLIIVGIAVFVLVVGTGIVAPLLTPYAKTFDGVTGINIGLLFSGFYCVRIIVGPYIGVLADKKGAKAIIKYSLILYPIIGLLYVVANTYWILILARLVHGLASAMMLPMVMTYIGIISPEGEESRYMSIYNTVVYLANGVGPAVGSGIASFYGYKIAFSSLLVLSVIAFCIISFLPDFQNNVVEKKELKNKKNMFVFKRNIMAVCIVQIVATIAAVFSMSFYSLYLISINVDTAIVGVILTIDNLIVGGSQIVISKFIDKINKERAIGITSTLLGLTTMLLVSITEKRIIIGIFVILSCLSAVLLLASSALSAIIGKAEGMGETMGVINSASSLGAVIGPVILGAVADYMSSNYIIVFTAICWFVGAIVFSVLYKNMEDCENHELLL